MTIQEMHIGIDLELQLLNSNAFGEVEPEEKDWFLNSTINGFVNQTLDVERTDDVRGGFGRNVRRIHDLNELIETETISLYQGSDYNFANFGILPYNCLELLSSRTESFYNCVKGVVGFGTISPKYISVVPFIKDINAFDKYFYFKIDKIDLVFTGTTLYSIANFYYGGFQTDEEGFQLVASVLEEVNKINGIKAYWGVYDGKNYGNSFIFVSDTNYSEIRVTFNLTTINSYPPQVINYFKTGSPETNRKIAEKADRLVRNDTDLETLVKNSFMKTKVDSPVTVLDKGRLYIFYDNTFYPNTSIVRFIRNPISVSLKHNKHCDLRADVHDEIVRRTAQRIAAITTSKNYTQLSNEINKVA